MKAAIYNGEKNIILTNKETPVCNDNDILVKNIYASICGSDIAVYFHGEHGHRIIKGQEFGHEMVSKVVTVGKNVKDIKVGDRVYPYPLLARGDPKRAGSLGGFSEYILIPNCELNKQVYKVSDKISSKVACLIEPFTVGTRAARRSNPKQDENAIVFGAGTIGIAAAIALKFFGCKTIMLVDITDFRLEKAKALGFETCNSSKEDLRLKASKIFGQAYNISGMTADVDIFIDAAGASEILDTYQAMGKIESRLVIVGVHHAVRNVDILAMTFSQHSLIGSGGYKPEDVMDVITIMESGKYDIESIITHEFEWENLISAIEIASKVDEALNVIIKY
ncbi:zinc-dependent alcohol dehydrogenase [Clostridium uliginosum]|uniref:L-iditol 2-dehydrogenase n=1 Tax=Clostridium uliginosum TaxID=119641 RepID=A0A1I1R0H9_9CLOT|nr:zinc-binding dehydrogenase [Clostridium uliginosum]SFD25628.1 L-iditol 2-dehydrogenase [Clostridium uliginosum]